MKIKYSITATLEGNLDELLAAEAPAVPTLAELLDAMDRLAFVAETVAHLHGLERSILPHTDRARELIARLTVQP